MIEVEEEIDMFQGDESQDVVAEKEDEDEYFDTSSDDELAEARKKIKEDKVEEKKKSGNQWVLDKDTPGSSEDDSNSEDYMGDGRGTDVGEDYEKKEKAIQQMLPDEDLKNMKWTVGKRFVGPEIFKEMVTRYAILSGYPIVWRKSDKHRKEAQCSEVECMWRIYASWDGDHDAFVVKVVNDEHSCERQDYKNLQVKPSFLAKEYLGRFKSDPNLKMKTLAEDVNARFGVDILKSTFYKTQKKARELLYGTLEEHYNKLGSYIKELKRVEPGVTIELLTEPCTEDGDQDMFKRIYISFPATRDGFIAGCRPFLCLDATFSKTPVGGVLLAAIAGDGNNQMFPVAWAVAEAETNDSWDWFMQILRKDLPGFGGEQSTIISDQHKGLSKAVKDWFPAAEHRNCARHIYQNWVKSGCRGGTLKGHFWKAVRSYTRSEYEVAVEAMKKDYPDAYKKFIYQNPTNFCRSKVRTWTKYETIVNNLAESFNGTILEARKKPLIDMLEDIREATMRRLYNKKEGIEKSDMLICPRVKKHFAKEKERVRGYIVDRSSKTRHPHHPLKLDSC